MTGRCAGWRARQRRIGAAGTDSGAAIVEFVALSVLVLIPVIYLVLTIFQIQRSAFGVTQAAREAGRSFATARTTSEAFARARSAAGTALADQGVDGAPRVEYVPAGGGCGPGRSSGGQSGGQSGEQGVASLRPGAVFVVCVRMDVGLPYTSGGRFAGVVPAAIPVTGQYEVVVDEYRRQR
ncbi:MAG: hypothetical protein ACXV5Q_13840 [Frankiaceae bacterium]